MENNTNKETPVSVPYVVYRDAIDDNRWVVKKLVLALIIAIALMFISNMAWLWYWNQFDYVSTETTVDSEGDGIANYTGGNGGVNTYGEGYSQKDNQGEADQLEGDESSQEEVNEPG